MSRSRRRPTLQYHLHMGDEVPGFHVERHHDATCGGTLLTGLGRYFASGCNTEGEIRGCLAAGHHVGICMAGLTRGGEEALRGWLHEQMDAWGARGAWAWRRVFIDSGAFGETNFIDGAPVVARPIHPREWDARLQRVWQLAQVGGPRLHVVTPDRVAAQDYTLALLEVFRPWLLQLRLMGARLIVPVQKGPAFTMAAFAGECARVLGPLSDGCIWGIPSKKDATSLADLAAFAGGLPPGSAIHFLGMGPHSPRYAEAARVVEAAVPGAEVWSDSVRLKALAGQGRPLTEAHRQAEAAGHPAPRVESVRRVLNEDHMERIARATAAGWRDEE